MKAQKFIWTTVILLLASVATMVNSAEKHQDGNRIKDHPGNTMPGKEWRENHLQNINDAIGKDIKNHHKEVLGEIDDVVLDDNRNIVYYVVLESEDNLFPVPWSAFERKSGDQCILNIPQGTFRQAPQVAELDMALLSSSAYRDRIREFYSQHITSPEDKNLTEKAKDWLEETFGSDQKPHLCLYSEVVGLDVKNNNDTSLGDLESVIIDDRRGNLVYGLVGYGGILGIGEDTSAVPWNALTIRPSQGVAILNATENTLKNATLKEDGIRQLNQPEFARSVHETFNTEPYWEIYGFVPPQQDQLALKQPWTPGSEYNRNFNPDNMTTIKGTIKSVGVFRPQKNAWHGNRLKVMTADGNKVTVYAGPCGFIEHNNDEFQLKPGHDITVTGSKTEVNGKSVIIASELSMEGKTIKLRNPQGIPLWDIEQLNQKKHQEKN